MRFILVNAFFTVFLGQDVTFAALIANVAVVDFLAAREGAVQLAAIVRGYTLAVLVAIRL